MTHFVDSSIWIPYFRPGTSEFEDQIDNLLDEDRIAINGIVRSELLVGTRSPKEYQHLLDSLEGLHWLESDQAFFTQEGLRNNFPNLRRGFVPSQGRKTELAGASEAFSDAGLGQNIKSKTEVIF